MFAKYNSESGKRCLGQLIETVHKRASLCINMEKLFAIIIIFCSTKTTEIAAA